MDLDVEATVESADVRSINLYLSVSELHAILEELTTQFKQLGEQYPSAKNAEVTESLNGMLDDITQLKQQLDLSHELREIKDRTVLQEIDAAAKERMSLYLKEQVDALIDAVPPVEDKEDNKKLVGNLIKKIQEYLMYETPATIELIEKYSIRAAKTFCIMMSIYLSTNWLARMSIHELKDFARFSAGLVQDWKLKNQAENASGSLSMLTVNPAPTAAPIAPVVPPIALPDEAFRNKLETEKFPDDNVTADLFKFASINQETPLSDPLLYVHKETRDLLNQMASLGSHPLFKFSHHPADMFEIQLLRGSNLTYKKPIEIAKIIYGLMQHSDTKQVKYPAEMGIPQTSALASLVADINSNFTVLQRELDQLKPKTLKRIANTFYNAQARNVARTAKSVESELGALHQQRVNQLTKKVDEVLRAKRVYEGTEDTPGVRNRHNFRIIEDRSEELKRLMREIKREKHSAAEMKIYKGIAEGAQKWSLGKHVFRTVRHAIWDGGKRTRRLRKKK